MHKKAIISLCLILSLTMQSAAFAGNDDTDTNGDSENKVLHTSLAVTGGCVGGAVLGTVVPIFGNLVGCAVGGIAGWWFGREKSHDATDHTALNR